MCLSILFDPALFERAHLVCISFCVPQEYLSYKTVVTSASRSRSSGTCDTGPAIALKCWVDTGKSALTEGVFLGTPSRISATWKNQPIVVWAPFFDHPNKMTTARATRSDSPKSPLLCSGPVSAISSFLLFLNRVTRTFLHAFYFGARWKHVLLVSTYAPEPDNRFALATAKTNTKPYSVSFMWMPLFF